MRIHIDTILRWLAPALLIAAAVSTARASIVVTDPDFARARRIFNCKCSGCHRPGSDLTDYTSYQTLLAGKDADGTPLIVPGDPDASPLYQAVLWNHDENHPQLDDEPMMPAKKSEWLTGGQLESLRRWIERGAPETCCVTSDGDSCLPPDAYFPSARECKACHPKQYSEWSRSMHAYAQRSPAFEAFTLTLQERTGGTLGTFCTRCHTPIGVAMGESATMRNSSRSRISQESVTCVVCHRMSQPYYKSNGRFSLEHGTMSEGCLYGPFDGAMSADIDAHNSAKLPHIKTSAFCGTCHDVTSPQGVRLEEAFSEWQHSPAARDGITCHQCHMGPVQGVPTRDCERPLGRAATVPGIDPELIPLRHLSDHTFAGPDYSLLPDTEFPNRLDWMFEKDYRQTHRLTKHERDTLRELRIQNRRSLKIAMQKRLELLGNAARIQLTTPDCAECGERLKICVEVESTTSGHNLPTGFTAERQVWVHIVVRDASGQTLFESGHLDHDGNLFDEHSHEVERGEARWDRHLLNLQSKFVTLTARGTERTVILPVNRHLRPLNFIRPAPGIAASFGREPDFRVAKASLPPLQTIRRQYPVRMPSRGDCVTVEARLNFRNLPPALFDRIGLGHLKHLLEIVVLDSATTQIQVR